MIFLDFGDLRSKGYPHNAEKMDDADPSGQFSFIDIRDLGLKCKRNKI